ncbi:MAG: thioredoxin domain-containing protein [Acidobacteriota bacterium]
MSDANRLIEETSPYLRLHAYNPVNWYPWGEEAFERARREEKPIFLSIGYTTCYWCHVMEREVFSDPEIAELMNLWFVNIKVDREERPEIDEIYMTTTQMLTGNGGWPNSVFLTPELEPFFAGTYFPPQDQEGRPGFVTILESLHRAWLEQRAEVETRARRIATTLRLSMSGSGFQDAPKPIQTAPEVVASLNERFDTDFGGFGTGAKFPSPSNLTFLWAMAREGDAVAEEMVVATLSAMGRGAIFDHLDGGFHRYTLDREWRLPHFEKMLYDNALLAELLATVAVETGDRFLDGLARSTLDFLLERMRLPNGAFKSAIDAETDGVEGALYLWTKDEVAAVVDAKDWDLFSTVFGFKGEPSFDDRHYTLYMTESYEVHAARLGLAPSELEARLTPMLERLAATRSLRPSPIVDDKVLCDWNGLTVAALARAGELLDTPKYSEAARQAASFLLRLRNDEGTQLHVWRNGRGKIPAFLDDYAFLVHGLLTLYETGGDARWLDEAKRLMAEAEERLAAPDGGYYISAPDRDLLVRPISVWDGSVPSGNGVMVLNQIRLTRATGDPDYRLRADRALGSFASEMKRVPAATATLALAALAATGSAAGGVDTIERLARDVVTAKIEIAADPTQEAWRDFRVTLEIRDGWHVNANPASLEFLIPTEVSGKVRQVRYPPGKSIAVRFADAELDVYESQVEIRGQTRASEEPVQLVYQACDDSRCLPPVTVDLAADGPRSWN